MTPSGKRNWCWFRHNAFLWRIGMAPTMLFLLSLLHIGLRTVSAKSQQQCHDCNSYCECIEDIQVPPINDMTNIYKECTDHLVNSNKLQLYNRCMSKRGYDVVGLTHNNFWCSECAKQQEALKTKTILDPELLDDHTLKCITTKLEREVSLRELHGVHEQWRNDMLQKTIRISRCSDQFCNAEYQSHSQCLVDSRINGDVELDKLLEQELY